VANIETQDHGATILAGNHKVLSARLSDAKFFWENDLRIVREKGFEGMAEGLSDVTFHNKLGSQADRVERIAALAREIAPLVGAKPDLAAEAARVCKADLQSEMVGEFPELQGLMGRYYAEAAGHGDGVPEACEEHYKPLGPGDAVPSAPVSVAVALADKIDTLCGFWWVNEKPTGSKDPFALRRAALGVIRLILSNGVACNLLELILAGYDPFDRQLRWEIEDEEREADTEAAKRLGVPVKLFEEWRSSIAQDKRRHEGPSDFERRLFSIDFSQVEHPGADLLAFLHDRLKVHLKEEGLRYDVIDACLAMPGNDDLTLLVKRAEALSDFLKKGFKRANNILSQAEEKDGVEYSFGADVKFAETEEEKALFKALDTAEPQITQALKAEDFPGAMGGMAKLRAPIDAFFEAVQVNVDNPVLRRNRLNLLSRIRDICRQAADLTKLEG
jgi:glycyl-tRNA synthetase beta chain